MIRLLNFLVQACPYPNAMKMRGPLAESPCASPCLFRDAVAERALVADLQLDPGALGQLLNGNSLPSRDLENLRAGRAAVLEHRDHLGGLATIARLLDGGGLLGSGLL